MNLHNDESVFKEAIRATSQALNMAEVYIEKDYWVTYSLKNLSKSAFKGKAIFKGGTSLSKAMKVIERFSEDIDLGVFLNSQLSGNQIKSLIKEIQVVTAGELREIKVEGITSKRSKFRKTVHDYGSIAGSVGFGQASDKLLIEVNSFTDPTPFSEFKIQCYIATFLQNREQFDLIKKYSLEPFGINVLDIKRTFVEKVLGLIRGCHSENPIELLKIKIRHIYDLERILRNSSGTELLDFLFGVDFFQMIKRVKKDDSENHEFAGDWLQKPLNENILFKSPEETWSKLKSTYENDFRPLVFGYLPKSKEITHCLKLISIRLKEYDRLQGLEV